MQATKVLAKACAARSIVLVYISTDYVFSSNEGEAPYQVDAQTGPTNIYGQTKLDGEKAILEEAGSFGVVLRVPLLYGSAENNAESAVSVLLDSVWKAQEKDARISVDDWAKRYPTNTEDVARICEDIAEKYLSKESKSLLRILQFSSEDCFTKFEIAAVR